MNYSNRQLEILEVGRGTNVKCIDTYEFNNEEKKKIGKLKILSEVLKGYPNNLYFN